MPIFSYESSNFMLKQQAIDWLVRLRSDDLGETEMVAFANWLAQDHAHSEAFAAAENLFDELVLAGKGAAFDANKQDDSEQEIENVVISPRKLGSKRVGERVTVRWLVYSIALAAVWLLIVILRLQIPPQSQMLNHYLSDYHTKTGELREIQLSDGSHLLLNTHTAVSVDFNASLRQVTLHHGQVRFNVAKDEKRPFEVNSDGLAIRALGTVFDVYQRPGEVSVTVQEHAVAIRIRFDAELQLATVNVQQGQQLQYHSGEKMPKPEAVELSQITAWQHQRLFINDLTLGEFINELSRYRIGRIFLSDEKLNNLRITGVFSLEHPEDVLSSVRKVLNLKETRLGPWWVLLHR